jgi:hypothetical protein
LANAISLLPSIKHPVPVQWQSDIMEVSQTWTKAVLGLAEELFFRRIVSKYLTQIVRTIATRFWRSCLSLHTIAMCKNSDPDRMKGSLCTIWYHLVSFIGAYT